MKHKSVRGHHRHPKAVKKGMGTRPHFRVLSKKRKK